jgi:hypothetical protein
MRAARVSVTALATAVMMALAGTGADPVAGQRPAADVPATRLPARGFLVAHRGASAYAPEHTLAAYRLALEQGADYVEQDLTLTRDGVLVCLHDDTLERTTDGGMRTTSRSPS